MSERVGLRFKMPEGATPEEAERFAEAIKGLADILHEAMCPDEEPPTVEIQATPDSDTEPRGDGEA